MKKDGFTLVELMAIIIVLGIIAMITVPVVNSTIKKSKQKAYEVQVSVIIEAAQKWGVKNVDKLPDENEMINVKLSELISGNYIENVKSGKLINPIDNTEMNGCVAIRYSIEYNQYEYAYYPNCS